MGKISILDYIVECICILEHSALLSFIITNTDSTIHRNAFTWLSVGVSILCCTRGKHTHTHQKCYTATWAGAVGFLLFFPQLLCSFQRITNNFCMVISKTGLNNIKPYWGVIEMGKAQKCSILPKKPLPCSFSDLCGGGREWRWGEGTSLDSELFVQVCSLPACL